MTARHLSILVLVGLLPLACAPGQIVPGSTGPSPVPTASPPPEAPPSPSAQPTASPSDAGPSASPTAPVATLTLVAGLGPRDFTGDGSAAVSAELNQPWGMLVNKNGRLMICDSDNSRIRQIQADGTITTVVGTATSGFNGDNITAATATLSQPKALATDPQGTIFIADTTNRRIRRWDIVTGLITTVAGNGGAGYHGDGDSALSATFSSPNDLATDAHDDLWVCDIGTSTVRYVDVNSNRISTIAGNGMPGYDGDGKAASSLELRYPEGLARDAVGNLYISDAGNSRIRKVGLDGLMTTIAGTGVPGFSGDGGPATQATINRPIGIAVAADGTVYFCDANNHRLRMIRPDGLMFTFAGDGTANSAGGNGPALNAGFGQPSGLTIAPDGSLYVTDAGIGQYDNRVWHITFPSGS